MSRRVALISASLLVALLGAGGLVAAQVSQKTRDEQAAAETRREIVDLRGELDALGRQRIDAGDVVVHLFRPEVRSFYNIEKIWAVDAPHRTAAN
jgi:ribosomal silencing factor RsfS